jgi:hypothetical protein
MVAKVRNYLADDEHLRRVALILSSVAVLAAIGILAAGPFGNALYY